MYPASVQYVGGRFAPRLDSEELPIRARARRIAAGWTEENPQSKAKQTCRFKQVKTKTAPPTSKLDYHRVCYLANDVVQTLRAMSDSVQHPYYSCVAEEVKSGHHCRMALLSYGPPRPRTVGLLSCGWPNTAESSPTAFPRSSDISHLLNRTCHSSHSSSVHPITEILVSYLFEYGPRFLDHGLSTSLTRLGD